jgi:hypothetical protein
MDDVSLSYHPAITATGTLSLTGNTIGVLSNAKATVEIIDNNIRSRLQATAVLKITSNTNLSTGSYSFTIGGQTFVAVTGAPAPTGEFQVAGSAALTAGNIVTKWNAQASGIATASALGSDSVLFIANSTNYSGEAGNSIATLITQSIASTWSLSVMGGGADGDSIKVQAPKFLNSGLVAYTYTSATGIVQFASAVTLPSSFAATDVFIDGAGNRFAVLGVDNALDQITIAMSQTVDTTVTANPSGSIYGGYSIEFGDGTLIVGASAGASATNLAARINTLLGAYVTAGASTSTVTVTSDYAGEFANEWTISAVDGGVINFTLSGSTFKDGRDADILSINGVELTAVSGTPSTDEFQPGATPTDTLLSIRDAILTSPSLTGVVSASVISGPVLAISAVTPGTAGNSITLAVTSSPDNAFTFSSATLTGGQGNLRVLTYNGSSWSNFSPDSDMIFSIRLSSDSLLVVAKSDDNGNQVLPQLSVNAGIDSSLGKRYYSDNGEISFLISSVSPNNFIVGATDVDVYGRGTVEGNTNVRVDQFIFRTSQVVGDVTNLREMEIPVLEQTDLNVNLLGGVS